MNALAVDIGPSRSTAVVIAAPPGENNDAQLFTQSRTFRIRQSNGLDFSNVRSTSPLRTVPILPLSGFHEVSRAEGPK